MQSLLNLWNALSAFLAEPSVQSAYDVMNGFNALIWGPPMIFLLLFLKVQTD